MRKVLGAMRRLWRTAAAAAPPVRCHLLALSFCASPPMAPPPPLRPTEWPGPAAKAPTAAAGQRLPASWPHDGRAAPLLPPAPDTPHERSATRSRRILVAGGILVAVVLVVVAAVLASESGMGKPVNAQTLDSGPYSVRFLAVRGAFMLCCTVLCCAVL